MTNCVAAESLRHTFTLPCTSRCIWTIVGMVATACVIDEVGGGEAGGDAGGGGDGGDGGIGGRDGGIGRLRDRHVHAVHVGQLTPQQLFP